MRKRQPPFTNSDARLSVPELQRYAEGWLLDGEIRQHSARTLEARRSLVDKLLWFLRSQEIPDCDALALRQFLAYCSKGHEAPGGRWGNPRLTKSVKPGTIATYYRILRALFNWIVGESGLSVSPMETLAPPIDRPDQVQPFSDAQINALLAAANRTHHPRRDVCIVLFLLDTGVRASELCGLRYRDLDMKGKSVTVEGKGGKRRPVYFGGTTAKALWQYLREEPRSPDAPLFQSDRGKRAGEPLTRNGLLLLIRRLGRAAGVESARSSPHTFRHTFAVHYLKNGGDQFSLMVLLGHTSIVMTAKYVRLAASDAAAKHRQHSPVDRLKKGKGD